jgi:hypothetical protein
MGFEYLFFTLFLLPVAPPGEYKVVLSCPVSAVRWAGFASSGGSSLRLMLMAFFALLQACTNTTPEPDYPPGWPLPHELVSRQCLPPAGLFSNQGRSSDPKDHNPTLAAVLFEDRLRGFPVESIRISQDADPDMLIIRGVLGGVELRRETRMVASQGDCRSRWTGEWDTDEVNSQLVSEAILFTGGLFIPLSERNVFSLQLAQDGALLIHLKVKAAALGALLVPIFFEAEYWLHYPLYRPDPVEPGPDLPAPQTVE